MMCALPNPKKIPNYVLAYLMFSNVCNIVMAGKQNEDYTPEQLTKLTKLRVFGAHILDSAYMRNDAYLSRWLKANDWNLINTQKHLEQVMKWRKENNYTTLLDEIPIPELETHPFYTISHSQNGQPVLLFSTKYFNVRRYVVARKFPQLLRNLRQSYEKIEMTIHNTRKSTGKNISQGIFLADLKEYNLRQHACLGCTPIYLEMTSGYERNHPYLYSKVILANAPRVFDQVFQLIKPLLSKATRDETYLYQVHSAEMKSKLLAMISPDQLPRSLGGTRHVE